jgi:hypothetical protein
LYFLPDFFKLYMMFSGFFKYKDFIWFLYLFNINSVFFSRFYVFNNLIICYIFFTILTEIWFITCFRKKCYLILTFQLYLAFSFFQVFHVVLRLDFFEFSINQQIADFVFFLQRVKIVFGLISIFLICFSSVKKCIPLYFVSIHFFLNLFLSYYLCVFMLLFIVTKWSSFFWKNYILKIISETHIYYSLYVWFR